MTTSDTAKFVAGLFAAIDAPPLQLYHEVVRDMPGLLLAPVPALIGVVQRSESVSSSPSSTLLREEITWHPGQIHEVRPDGMCRFGAGRSSGWVHRRHVRWGRTR